MVMQIQGMDAVIAALQTIAGTGNPGPGSFTTLSATGNTTLTTTQVGTFTATGLVDISGAGAGQIKFPATQNASSNANTLDDYEEGTWTPVLTFATPGDLSVTYSSQTGFYRKIGSLVACTFNIGTSAFTFTTASGGLQITGVPFASLNVSGATAVGPLFWGGITKATYTTVVAQITPGTSLVGFVTSGSGAVPTSISATDTPTGGTMTLRSSTTYMAAS